MECLPCKIRGRIVLARYIMTWFRFSQPICNDCKDRLDTWERREASYNPIALGC